MFHFNSISRTGVIFRAKKMTKGNNSKNIEARVMDLVRDSCQSSALSICEVLFQ